MRTSCALTMCILTSFAVFTAAVPADAQTIIQGGTALDNAATAGARAPGNMVANGLSRVQEFAERAAAGPQITEQAPPETDVWSQALADSITILFDQLDQAIFLFHNLLLARAGEPLIIPTDILPDFSDTSGTDETGDGTFEFGDLHLADLDLSGLLDQFSGSAPKTCGED